MSEHGTTPRAALRPGSAIVQKLLLSLAVAAGFVWLLRAGALPVLPSAEAFARVRPLEASLAFAAWASMLLVRGLRWQVLLASVERLSTRAVLAAGMLGFAATMLFPLRTGEAVRPLLIRREGGNAWAATGTVGAERIADGLFVSVMLLGALAFAPPRAMLPDEAATLGLSPRVISELARGAAIVFALASAGAVLLFQFRGLFRKLLIRSLGRVRPALAEELASRAELVASGLGLMTRWSVALPFLGASALYWGLNVLGVWTLARGVGLHGLSPAACATLVGVLALGILPPSGPGMFGSYQVALYAGLFLYFPKPRLELEGSALVFFVYSIHLSTLLIGALFGLVHVLSSERTNLSGSRPLR